MKRTNDAINALRKSLEIREKIFGKGHKNCEENRRLLEVKCHSISHSPTSTHPLKHFLVFVSLFLSFVNDNIHSMQEIEHPKPIVVSPLPPPPPPPLPPPLKATVVGPTTAPSVPVLKPSATPSG
jgi:hypothetical protein